MAYTRECVALKQEVVLKALFTDTCGDPIDVDAILDIDIAIYRPDDWAAFDDPEVEIAAAYPNALEVIAAAGITKLATGYYEVTYTLPAGETDVGNWTDLWVASVNGIQVFNSFTINVVEKGVVSLQTLQRNKLIVIVLSSTIADIAGSTLAEETQIAYSTLYDPYYASTDLLRLECGPWLDGIPDDTLSLMIHWSSIEADAISMGYHSGTIINRARTYFAVYDAAVRTLLLPADTGGKRKMLGDLLIENDTNFSNVIKELKAKRDEWWRVVNAGGSIVPGQGLPITVAVRGSQREGYEKESRAWHDPARVNYTLPTVNSKFLASYDPRKRHGYTRRISAGSL